MSLSGDTFALTLACSAWDKYELHPSWLRSVLMAFVLTGNSILGRDTESVVWLVQLSYNTSTDYKCNEPYVKPFCMCTCGFCPAPQRESFPSAFMPSAMCVRPAAEQTIMQCVPFNSQLSA